MNAAPIRTQVLGVALLALALGGCGLFRETPPAQPQDVRAEQVAAGVPSSAPVPPLPVTRDAGRTYHIVGRNDVVFSATGTPAEVAADLERQLTDAGYTITGTYPQADGGVALTFSRDSRLGSATVLPSAPARFDPTLDFRGTFVELLYDLEAPPAPTSGRRQPVDAPIAPPTRGPTPSSAG